MRRKWRDLAAAGAETRRFSSRAISLPPASAASTTAGPLTSLLARVASLDFHPYESTQRLSISSSAGQNPFDVAKIESKEYAEEEESKGSGNETRSDDEELWEEDEGDDVEPKLGDGRDGGGIVLNGVTWGERALALAEEVLCSQFDSSDLKLFAFRVSPGGYIYVRLDKLSDKYGCPGMDELERFNHLYDESLEECGRHGEIPDNLAVEISSPGATRLLKVPDDLERFKNFPMVVQYLEEEVAESKRLQERDGVFHLVSLDNEAGKCTWKLADVRENRKSLSKGRPLSKKMKDWRLTLPFEMVKRATFYLNF